MFAEAIESILNDHCAPNAVREIEAGGQGEALLAALKDSGFFGLLAREDDGGGGAGMTDFFPVVLLCGAHSVPLPLVQTMAARLLVTSQAGLPEGLIAFAPNAMRAADGSVRAERVSMGKRASHVIAGVDGSLLVLAAADAQITDTGVAGSMSATFHWPPSSGQPLPDATTDIDTFRALAALLHAGLMAGAMKRCFEMTLAYGNERVQFGKSIGKFQSIQHSLSVMAEHVAAGCMAAEAAFSSGEKGLPGIAACAAAKARTSEAAQLVATIAHAIHGAIGVTAEYDLQLSTRRLHEWRMAHGSESYWNRLLGGLVLRSGTPLISDFVRTI